jgi:hypothetical protein
VRFAGTVWLRGFVNLKFQGKIGGIRQQRENVSYAESGFEDEFLVFKSELGGIDLGGE